MRFYFVALLAVFFISCQDEVKVKPSAQLRLEYPKASYDSIKTSCPFILEKNKLSEIIIKPHCGLNISYPFMDATIYITYQPVHKGNIDSLLYDAQKLTYDHSIKADNILEQPRVDPEHKVYGMFYAIEGNAATPSQFYVTDSTKHFLAGSVYFNVKPNYDSLYPAVSYLRNDVRKIMESIQWKDFN